MIVGSKLKPCHFNTIIIPIKGLNLFLGFFNESIWMYLELNIFDDIVPLRIEAAKEAS